jgi:ubiquinol-cytochrome c reductase cytochrome b subunit
MKKTFMLLVLGLLPLFAFANEAEKACGSIDCDKFEPALHDQAALQRGAKTFVNYCMGCHAMAYMRYERMADDLGIPHDVAQKNLNFSEGNIGDLMTIAAPAKEQKKWFGATPPDLSLVARARGVEWLYTYLRNFYQDDKRPYGVNNRVFKDVGMPHVMLELQGMAKCAPGPVHAANGGVLRDPLTREEILVDPKTGAALNPCGRLVVEKAGKLNKDEFDRTVGDLVSFLAYAGEPAALKRQRMGVYALFFVSLFFIFAWLLNREYWKDVH